jgi:hypothetical protein
LVLTGFTRYLSAPTAGLASALPAPPWAVRKDEGIDTLGLCRSLAELNPSISGIEMSETMISTGSFKTIVSASFPFVAVRTANPTCRRSASRQRQNELIIVDDEDGLGMRSRRNPFTRTTFLPGEYAIPG